MREIEPKMIAFLDKKLVGNGLYEEAVEKKDARTVFRLAAQVCVGIREEGGNNKGPMVELIQETVGGHSQEAWCMAFVQTCLAYAERRTGVKSPIPAGEHCTTIWKTAPKVQRVKIHPLAGAIVIWQHGAGPSGHTGVIESCDNKNFYAFEGNTEAGLNSKGNVEADGGGVYHTFRGKTGNGSMKVLGFLKPF